MNHTTGLAHLLFRAKQYSARERPEKHRIIDILETYEIKRAEYLAGLDLLKQALDEATVLAGKIRAYERRKRRVEPSPFMTHPDVSFNCGAIRSALESRIRQAEHFAQLLPEKSRRVLASCEAIGKIITFANKTYLDTLDLEQRIESLNDHAPLSK